MLDVIYDGDCDFCLTAKKIIQKFDWFQRLRWQTLQGIGNSKFRHLVDSGQLAKEMHLVDSKERIFRGFFAFRRIAIAAPIFWVALPLLYFPGFSWLGQRLYLYIARNRKLWNCNGQCHI